MKQAAEQGFARKAKHDPPRVYKASGKQRHAECDDRIYEVLIETPLSAAVHLGRTRRERSQPAPAEGEVLALKNRATVLVFYGSSVRNEAMSVSVQQGNRTYRPASGRGLGSTLSVCGRGTFSRQVWLSSVAFFFDGPDSLPLQGEAQLVAKRPGKIEESIPITFSHLK